MRLSVLDGFGRVHSTIQTQTPDEMKGRDEKIGFGRIYDDNTPGRDALDGLSLQGRKTKRSKRQAKSEAIKKIQPLKTVEDLKMRSGKNYGKPIAKKKMQGYSRLTYLDKDLQGLSLQGQTILQGYSLGTSQDLDEWNYLLNIEHPCVMDGFPTFVLNGKADRKAKRQAKKTSRGSVEGSVRPKKAKRLERKGASQDRKQRRKEVRVAKKEENLLKKQTRRADRTAKKEGRTERKQSRIDQRTDRRALREETKRLKAGLKSQRPGIFDQIKDISEDILPDVVDLMKGGGDFQDMTSGDMDFLPDQIQDFISDQQGQDPDDILDDRSQLLDDSEIDPSLDDVSDAGAGADATIGDDAEDKKGFGLLPILGIAGIGLAMTSKKGKKGKKKK